MVNPRNVVNVISASVVCLATLLVVEGSVEDVLVSTISFSRKIQITLRLLNEIPLNFPTFDKICVIMI